MQKKPDSDFPARLYFDELNVQLQTMHTNCSVYCSACGLSYWPDISARELEVLSSRGDLLCVCPHCFYCASCHRWSTPTERDQAFTWNDLCEHGKRLDGRPAFGQYIPDRDLTEIPRQGQGRPGYMASVKGGQAEPGVARLTQMLAPEREALAPPRCPSAIDEGEVQIERLQLFASLSGKLRIERDQAIKSLALFWKQVERTSAGCWRWHGERSNTTLYYGVSWQASTHRVDAFKLAWTLGTGRVFPDHSRALPQCSTADCINPEHKIEAVWLPDVWWWLRPGDHVGEDDWQEIAYRFKQQVDAGRVSALYRDGRTAVRRADFEEWLRDEGSKLIAEFSSKYRVRRGRAASRAKRLQPSAGLSAYQSREGEPWWQRLGLSQEQLETQVKRFQEIARLEGGGQQLDQAAARRNLERFYSRIATRQGECWAWSWRESLFRLYRYGPWIDPRELAWWLATGTIYRGLRIRLASHNGSSWCLNPAHSDVEFTTISAALFLMQTTASPSPAPQKNEPHPLDEPVQELRHLIHHAVERGALPYRLEDRTLSLKIWRTDLLTWWKGQR